MSENFPYFAEDFNDKAEFIARLEIPPMDRRLSRQMGQNIKTAGSVNRLLDDAVKTRMGY